MPAVSWTAETLGQLRDYMRGTKRTSSHSSDLQAAVACAAGCHPEVSSFLFPSQDVPSQLVLIVKD